MPSRIRGNAQAILVPLLLTLLIYLVPVGGSDLAGNPNELSRILMTEAIVMDGSVAVDGPITAYGDSQDQSVREGRTYSDKAPGVSYLAVLPAWLARAFLPVEEGTIYTAYWPLRHLLVVFLVAVPAVPALFALFLPGEGGPSPGSGPWVAALLCVATPMLTYGVTLFSHVPAALLVAGAGMLAMRGEPTARRAALGGVLAGMAVTTEYPTLLLGGVFGMVLVWRRPFPWRAAAAYGLGMAAGIVPALIYHAVAFGSPFTTGYAFKVDTGHAQISARGASGVVLPGWERFQGVMLSSSRGLLFYCPLLALSVAGIVARARVAAREAWGVAAAGFVYLLFGAAFVDWQGGWCAAARHLVPIVPLLALGVVWSIREPRGARWRMPVLAALAGVSAAHQVLSVVVTPLFPEIFERPLAQVAARSLLDGAAMPSFVSDFTGLPRLAVALAWALLVAGLVLRASWIIAGRNRKGVAAAGIALAAMVAAAGAQVALSSRITPEQEYGRAVVLDRLGYHELARRLAGER